MTIISLAPAQTCYWFPDSVETPRQAVAIKLDEDDEPVGLLLMGLIGPPKWVDPQNVAATQAAAWWMWGKRNGVKPADNEGYQKARAENGGLEYPSLPRTELDGIIHGVASKRGPTA